MGRIALSITAAAWIVGMPSAHAATNSHRNGGYRIDVNEVAENCEYYIDKFGAAYDDKGVKWLEGVVRPHAVFANGRVGTILGVGAAVTYQATKDFEQPIEYVFGKFVGGQYIVVIPYQDRHGGDSLATMRCAGGIRKFNVFVDVEDRVGRIYRLWAAPIDEVLNLESVFWGYPYSFRERGEGAGITYTFYPSPIMKLKNRCALR